MAEMAPILSPSETTSTAEEELYMHPDLPTSLEARTPGAVVGKPWKWRASALTSPMHKYNPGLFFNVKPHVHSPSASGA